MEKKYLLKKINIKMKIILIILSILTSLFVTSQEYNKILIVNGYLHVGNGQTIEKSLIGIEDGIITMVKNNLTTTYSPEEWDTIIDAKGQHIYPGLVAPNSTLGITEIDAVRATRDFDEVGAFNPHVRSQIAYNVESKVISTVRTNGVLISQATPRGGVISGSSSVMKLDGWNWEDATISASDGIHLNWPSSIAYWKSPKEKNKDYQKQKDEIFDFFEMAKTYALVAKNKEKDIRLEAMKDCFFGKKRVYIHANEIQQLIDIIEFSKHFNLAFPVIVGGYDAHLIAQQLIHAKIPVMLVRTHSLPKNEDDDIDLPYKLPYLLQKAGVQFCLQNAGDMEAMNARNIPFLAGTAMAYGLTMEEAIHSVTLSSCKIMGIENKYGSIEKGKSATLFISKGNALDMRTNQLTFALIEGVFMSLENSQNILYKKYKAKYEREKK